MSKTERGIRDGTGPYAGSYEERIGGGKKKQCWKKLKEVKFVGGKK